VRGGSPAVWTIRDLFPTGVPYLHDHTATGTDNSVYTEYDFSKHALEIGLVHDRSGSFQSYAGSYGYLTFRVDQDVDYRLEGVYAADDPQGRTVYQGIYLLDVTSDAFLFQGLQRSASTPDESFTVGLSEGDTSNSAVGSVTGTLLAGHNYLVHYDAFIGANVFQGSEPASAAGYFRIELVAACRDGRDNDLDGSADWNGLDANDDGDLLDPGDLPPDSGCGGDPDRNQELDRCGLGSELAGALALILGWRRIRRRPADRVARFA
jgi:hypothetical protein